MLSFSQRKGLKAVRTTIQLESVDEPLRNQLWNCVSFHYFDRIPQYISDDGVSDLLKSFWVNYYELRLDELARPSHKVVEKVKDDFISGSWDRMYDILEFLPNHCIYSAVNQKFIEVANRVLTKYLSAYRFVGKLIVDITSEQEIQSLEDALKDTSNHKYVQNHLSRALQLLADRDNPDYRNSIKESISAVEALCSEITGKPKATLGQALAEIEKTHQLHTALKESFSKLYGWTSDAEGIRHKLLEESTLGQEDAKFMLVTCSAFINYLLVKVS